MPSHNVFLCLVAFHAHTAAQSATKHKAHYATLHFSSWRVGDFMVACPLVCFAGAKKKSE
jgi:hypothetical protein